MSDVAALHRDQMSRIATGGNKELNLRVLIDLLAFAEQFDPAYDVNKGTKVILDDLDALQISGMLVWKFFSHLCGKNWVNCLAVLKAWKAGKLTQQDIFKGMETKGDGWDFRALVRRVKGQYPDFCAEQDLRKSLAEMDAQFAKKGRAPSAKKIDKDKQERAEEPEEEGGDDDVIARVMMMVKKGKLSKEQALEILSGGGDHEGVEVD